MSVFSPRDRRALQEMLAMLRRPVAIMGFVENAETDEILSPLFQEITHLVPGLVHCELVDATRSATLVEALGVQILPSLRFVGSNGEFAPVEMLGSPTGYQFGSFLNLLMNLSQARPLLGHAISGALKNVDQDIYIEVIVTATCPNSPQVVRIAQASALANPSRVFARSFDAVQFPELLPAESIDLVPYTQIYIAGQLIAARAGMMSAKDLWMMIHAGLKGVGIHAALQHNF